MEEWLRGSEVVRAAEQDWRMQKGWRSNGIGWHDKAWESDQGKMVCNCIGSAT